MTDHPRLALHLMMVLTLVTGIVDAVGYLGLDRVFVGNMTGNVVVLAMAITGGDDLPVIGPAIALGTFTLGAYAGGILLRHRRKSWGGAVTALLMSGAAVLGGVAIVVAAAHGNEAADLAASSLSALAMGSQAAVARSLAVADMTTVVVTSTLTSLASESFVEDGPRGLWSRRFAAIASIFVGALVGAALLQAGLWVPLTVAALLTATVASIGHARLYTPPIEDALLRDANQTGSH